MPVPTRRSCLQQVLGAAGIAPLAAACGAVGQGSQPPAAAAGLTAGATVTFWNDIAGQYVGLMQRWADTFQQRTGVKIEVTGGVGDYEAKLLDTRFWTGQETAAQVAKQIKDQGAAFLKA